MSGFGLTLLTVATLAIGLGAPGPKGHLPPQAIAADGRADVIAEVLRQLERQYVLPDVASRMVASIRQRQKDGRYDALDTPEAFASALTADLQAVSSDRHLRIVVTSRAGGPAPGAAPGPSPQITGQMLDGNIGYLRLDGFPSATRLAAVLDPLMKDLASADALIIDLRQNRGGSPDGVTYLAGYLLPAQTLLARIYSRPDDSTIEMRTKTVGGERYPDRPVFILTSATTFSAAEAAAYHLKHLGRATTVGEATGGGAHRVQTATLSHGFSMIVPFARPINVVTGADWEGTGVTPDRAVPAAAALTAAHITALEGLPPSPSRSAALARIKKQ